ncbi:hypothetical protein Z012_01090 [Avibacterium paragallinarum]|nr:hypothetical protein Z012_01090 [Avibacterium paragallinarum]
MVQLYCVIEIYEDAIRRIQYREKPDFTRIFEAVGFMQKRVEQWIGGRQWELNPPKIAGNLNRI